MASTDLRERNRRANTAVVQQVALGLMERRGFDGVTIAEIAEEAGVSPSTVYRYFGTKEALVLSGGGADGLVRAVAAAARDHRRATRAEIVTGAVTAMLADVDHDSLLRRMRLAFADPSLAAALEHETFGHRHELAHVLAAHRGAKTPGVRDDAAAGAVLGVLLVVLDRWQRSTGDKPLAKQLSKALNSVL